MGMKHLSIKVQKIIQTIY